MPLASFVDQYKMIIFDMDGVITSEQNYWNCAALTVYECLHSNKLYGSSNIDTKYCMDHVKEIRDEVFYQDKIITILKEKGVNSNWDLAYIVIGLNLILKEKSSPKSIFAYIRENFHQNIIDDYVSLSKEIEKCIDIEADRASTFWFTITQIFQHWFLGDVIFLKNSACPTSAPGKMGFLEKEKPIIDKTRLQLIMKSIYDKGIKIGIATGRPQEEMLAPLKLFGIDQYMDSHCKISYDYVKRAEDKMEGMSLTKPHPFIFLKSLLSDNYSDFDIVEGNFDKDLPKKALIVGDAGSDILAAQSMGSDFLAVLTGVNGKKGRQYFEDIGSTYILDSLDDIYYI